MEQGELLKRYGIDLVASHNVSFIEEVRAAAKWLSDRVGQVTIDDVRLWANMNDVSPHHHNAWGAVFHGRRWKRIGFTQSQIPSNHARIISVWKYE